MDVRRNLPRWLAALERSLVEIETTREGWKMRGKGPLGVLVMLAALYLLLS